MTSWKPIAIGLLVVGCGAHIGGGGGDDNNAVVDGSTSIKLDGGNGSGSDAGATGQDASSAACPSGRRVFLAFDGVTLTNAATSNAEANQARWVNNGTSNVPAWHSGSGTRAADIANVLNGVKSRLGTAPIEVTTTRPATGPYVMITFGGQSTGNGGGVGTIYGAAVSYHDCGDATKSDVGWIADGFNLQYTADLAVGAIGWGLGLDGTTDPNDCMCGWANGCNSATGACTLSANIATSITANGEAACPGQNPQNEVAAFTTKFCQ